MFKSCSVWAVGAVLALLSCAALADHLANEASAPGDGVRVDADRFSPIPQTLPLDAAKVALGKRLFEDKRISAQEKMACVECHLADKGGTDNHPLSMAINGELRSTNTPSIFNVGLLPKLGWIGTGSDLGDVAESIIKSKQGLATTLPEIVDKLGRIPEYRAQFSSIYKTTIKPEQVKDALAEYMKAQITPDSRFDQYLRGQADALTEQELEGYRLFKNYGCAACHNGMNLGGNMVAPFGVFGNYMLDHGDQGTTALGLYNKTKREEDKYVFRVPSLRNVALTEPYFHDGSAQDLTHAVDIMSRYMLGRKMPPRDIALIVKFLNTLTGSHAGKPL